MLLVRLTSPLFRAVPWAGKKRRGPAGRDTPGPECGSRQPRGRGAPPELEETLVPRKMSISPLESWLTARCLLPGLDAGTPGTVAPPQSHECQPCRTGERGVGGAPPMRGKNVLKIRRRKMNRHKYRKLVKRTRFLRRKIREGRLKRKQLKFERDLRRIWLKAGLKEAPEGWQTPKSYQRGR
uniref:Small ribosomal subunit protein mS38 n=1 Tax=Cebus imitator TaxID=2715852 RepID=A0A2K5SC89_CEBIM